MTTERTPLSRLVREWVVLIAAAALIAWAFESWAIQSFSIPSESMAPTLTDGDRVLVNKLSYRAHDVRRGDVVVVERPATAPKGSADDPDDLIKRVIGLPGDTIEARGGTVYINGRPLTEPYLGEGTITDRLDTPLVVPKGEVFLLGDNRMDSKDSRAFGPVPVDSVVGRAFALIWPPNRVAFL